VRGIKRNTGYEETRDMKQQKEQGNYKQETITKKTN